MLDLDLFKRIDLTFGLRWRSSDWCPRQLGFFKNNIVTFPSISKIAVNLPSDDDVSVKQLGPLNEPLVLALALLFCCFVCVLQSSILSVGQLKDFLVFPGRGGRDFTTMGFPSSSYVILSSIFRNIS